jgi:hypothetical protein
LQLAPALKTPFDEFIEAWRNVTNYFVSPQGMFASSNQAHVRPD